NDYDDGKDGQTGKPGKDADEEKIIGEVLKKILNLVSLTKQKITLLFHQESNSLIKKTILKIIIVL
ncbi:MAG: hypothetical protein EBU90_31560, partial [Proteobacteria bacterium]|nr:hypothetical protein [Pseudomonadota bacterium]